jgi:hypothetical protein
VKIERQSKGRRRSGRQSCAQDESRSHQNYCIFSAALHDLKDRKVRKKVASLARVQVFVGVLEVRRR